MGKQNGNIIFNDTMLMNDKKYSSITLDTSSAPYTMVWHQATSGSLVPSIKLVTGQDDVITRVWPSEGNGFRMETTFGENYKFLHNLEIDGSLYEEECSGLWSWELQKGDMSLHKHENTLSWYNGEDKIDAEMSVDVSLTRDSPLYKWGDCLFGKYFTTMERHISFTYNKLEENLLLGKILLEDKMTMDNEPYSTITFDTTRMPNTFVWNQDHSGYLSPNLWQYVIDQDDVSLSLWMTPDVELKLETNIPIIETFKIDLAEDTKKVELNGVEMMTVDYTSAPPTLSKTVESDNGEQLIMSLSWPKLQKEASDLVVYLEYAPYWSIEGDMGWQYKAYSPNTIYMDFKCNSSYLDTEYSWGFTKMDGVFLPH